MWHYWWGLIVIFVSLPRSTSIEIVITLLNNYDCFEGNLEGELEKVASDENRVQGRNKSKDAAIQLGTTKKIFFSNCDKI